MVDERLLKRMQRAIVRQTLDRGDLRAIVHDGERQAGIDTPSVDENGASAALALIAAFFRAGQVQMLAQQIKKRRAGIKQSEYGLPLTVRPTETESGVVKPFSD